jgi:hypothetical protein
MAQLRLPNQLRSSSRQVGTKISQIFQVYPREEPRFMHGEDVRELGDVK